MTDLVFRDDAYTSSCAAHVVAADAWLHLREAETPET